MPIHAGTDGTVRVTAPTGTPGASGAAATIAVGTVTTLAAGSSVTVVNSGTSAAATFDFGIPRGADGAGTGDFKADGSVAMTANFDAGGFQVTNVGNVDGRDVSADGTKLDGIATAATANDTDANLKARANHTGTQTLSTISDAGTVAGLDEATSAQFRSNTTDKALSTDQVWGAAAHVTLTDAASIAVDFSTFLNATVTLAGNRALANPSNTKVGQSGLIRVVQDATGTRTLSYGTSYKFAGGTAPTLSTAANSIDYLFYYIASSTEIFISAAKDIS